MSPYAKLRERQIEKHTIAVIWYSIMAVEYDRLRMPQFAQDASDLAAANCKCILYWVGPTNPVDGDNSFPSD